MQIGRRQPSDLHGYTPFVDVYNIVKVIWFVLVFVIQLSKKMTDTIYDGSNTLDFSFYYISDEIDQTCNCITEMSTAIVITTNHTDDEKYQYNDENDDFPVHILTSSL